MTDAPAQPPDVAAAENGPNSSEMEEEAEAQGTVGFPPYPPYAVEPVPPSLADTIIAGRDLRITRKSTPKKAVRPAPKPARPRGPKATDVKLTKRAARAHARCLRRHNAVLTDRLERISKPNKRTIIYLWRQHGDRLPEDTIARLRSMLDADEPFKPDQAYEYFVNLKKQKKQSKSIRVNQIKKDMLALCADKRFVWARNATVAFARGIQQRLSRPGRYALADGMLRLSNIIMDEICGYMHMRTPSRRCTHPKAKFMMEMSDKVAVWIDEILSESDDRMLMMDFDEDEDVLYINPAQAEFTDDFLNMMGGAGDLLRGPTSAYLKFTGDMMEAFDILTRCMYKEDEKVLVSHGKTTQTYKEAADELKEAEDFDAADFNLAIAQQMRKDLADIVKNDTPKKLTDPMHQMVNICGNYLAQLAEFNKDKGPAFKLLIEQMKNKGNDQLYTKGKAQRTYTGAAKELEKSKSLETDHEDPNLSQEIHAGISKVVENVTPDNLKKDMKETLDMSSKYLSQRAIDEIERGPAFHLLIKTLEADGQEDFVQGFPGTNTKFETARTLKSAPGLSCITPDPERVPMFEKALHIAVDPSTPAQLKSDMNDVIKRCANYLSAFVRDRDKVMEILLEKMSETPTKELAKRNNYAMSYQTGVEDTRSAPIIVPYLPVKDISDEIKQKLTAHTETVTPVGLEHAMKSCIHDVSQHLSQPVALRSGAAGARYGLDLLTSVVSSLAKRPLFSFKSYAQTYSDGADELKYAGPLDTAIEGKHENLQAEIQTEMGVGVPGRLAGTLVADLQETMEDSSKHLAKVGVEKGEAFDHLVKIMKEEGDVPLAVLQGYEQTYKDAAERLSNTPSLTSDKVDRDKYESVKGKLTALAAKKPLPGKEEQLTSMVNLSSEFLASPAPETVAEKRQVLSDLMARKGSEMLTEDRMFKLTYKEGGKEIKNAPVGVVTSGNPIKQTEISGSINKAIPDKKLKDTLKDAVNEGSAHLTDLAKGKGEAMELIYKDLKNEGSQEFMNVGKFKATHGEAGELLKTADNFDDQKPSPVLLERAKNKIDALPKSGGSDIANAHMNDAVNTAANYIAGVATRKSGLDAKALAALARSDALSGGAGGAGTASSGADGAGAAEGHAGAAEGHAGAAEGHAGAAEGHAGAAKAHAGAAEGHAGAAEGHAGAAEGHAGAAEGYAGETEAQRKAREAKNAGKGGSRGKHGSRGLDDESDPERKAALSILHNQLRAKGTETLYKQPQTELTHTQASDWLSQKQQKVEKSVKESADTARLHKKFERKLSNVVSKSTPTDMRDVMQDVVIESSRILSEIFVSTNYKALVKDALISEMQRRGNEILVDIDGAAESYFFAAQRLKKATSLKVEEPCDQVSYFLSKKLDDMIRCWSMARKLTATMKEHVKEAAAYLSEHVTKPDEQIEAYVAMLSEMEATGDALLIEGDIPKSYKSAAAYLRQLTSFEDQINRPNSTMQSAIEGKLKSIMANVPCHGYTQSVLGGVIRDSARLLVSYIMLQGEKTEVLKILVNQLENVGDLVLLRHGNIRKTYKDGASVLRGKNADQLRVTTADPVVSRKIQIKLLNLMHGRTPDKYEILMEDVIEEATMYLAVSLLQPRTIRVCKCMKNVFVQCELWCDEIFRHVARPCCTCSRHVSAQALADLVPARELRVCPGDTRVCAPGLEISISPCPASSSRAAGRPGPAGSGASPGRGGPCPGERPTSGCPTTPSYMLYSTSRQPELYAASPSDTESPSISTTTSSSLPDRDPVTSCMMYQATNPRWVSPTPTSPTRLNAHLPIPMQKPSTLPTALDSKMSPTKCSTSFQQRRRCDIPTRTGVGTGLPLHMPSDDEKIEHPPDADASRAVPQVSEAPHTTSGKRDLTYWQPQTTMFTASLDKKACSSFLHSPPLPPKNSPNKPSFSNNSPYPASNSSSNSFSATENPNLPHFSPLTSTLTRPSSPPKSGYSTRTPIVTTDQMSDWHAMMVSLMWNVQAWRDWIQENIDRALTYKSNPSVSIDVADDNWATFERRLATEALQWRQYSIFSRQLTLRLNLRYRNKQIVSPTRATNKTQTYMECQQEMMKIIEMFSRWTQWLIAVVKETESLYSMPGSEQPMHELRWIHFKEKIEEYAEDWVKYNMHLKVSWEHKYRTLISDWLPAWKQPGPVWVVSAYGAVPSGAVAAGLYGSELVWVARTTHRCKVLPAALHSTKHCCIVYADGAVHHYTKYQAMCNADVNWLPWRAGRVGARAVRVAPGVFVGRVLYHGSHLVGAVFEPHFRCHVVIFGRAFAFKCYELLVLAGEE